MANSGFTLPGFAEINIPLNSYSTQQTAWGLIDAAGMTSEWTEYAIEGFGILTARGSEGSYWTETTGGANSGDFIGSLGAGDGPDLNSLRFGFRVAAAIPAPSCSGVMLGLMIVASRRRRQGGFHVAVLSEIDGCGFGRMCDEQSHARTVCR
jgi:hypothetical protein